MLILVTAISVLNFMLEFESSPEISSFAAGQQGQKCVVKPQLTF